jgi:hypothetical protein
MSPPKRFAQYVQRLAYQSLFAHEEGDERPDDAPRAPAQIPDYASWNAASFSTYMPFRTPSDR